LPSPAGLETAVGGAGRFLFLPLPKDRQLAAFDATTGKVAKYLPVADDRPLAAAGRSVLLVYAPSANAFVRYRLPTFEKEATTPSPVADVRAVGMGSATDGPLFVLSKAGRVSVLDPRTLRPVPGLTVQGIGLARSFYRPGSAQLAVSADGRLLGGEAAPLARQGDTYVRVRNITGYALPTTDGRAFLVDFNGMSQVFTADGQPVGQPAGGHGRARWLIPAAHGPYHLSANQTPGARGSYLNLQLHAGGDGRLLGSLPRVEAVQKLIDWVSGRAQPLDRHVFLFPDVKLLAALPADRTKLVLLRVDADAVRDKAGVDYLEVASRPPASVTPGKAFHYTPAVRSKKGKARLRLEGGPPGMKLADGQLTWDVPADQFESVTVVLAVTDASGQEVFHTFTLAIHGTD
jgi:hypothetical protein